MADFYIRYGLGGGFGGPGDWEVVQCDDFNKAEDAAYEAACETYESYAGMHGLQSVEEIMEEEQCDEAVAQEIFNEYRESWLDYEVRASAPHD